MSDTFAHFFGTKIGRVKLCPNVSPNKTVEGMIGGTIFGTFIPTVYFLTFISRQKKSIFHLRHRENHHQFRLILRHIHR